MVKSKEFLQNKQFDIISIEKEISELWKKNNVFEQSIANRKDKDSFVFYEGPPSANGMPGIHHVMSRTIKDVFCRYYTLKGFKVERKAGWDTHGLPVELQVEKSLGITKEDIGKSISIADYNKACRADVLKFKDKWDELTEKIGYWLDMDAPYITYENAYMESVWNLLQRLYKKGFLYKGFTIQPYSPAAGTGLSSHELNQPGTYKDVKDTSVVAQFKLIDPQAHGLDTAWADTYFLAWTTTPWTLPSNTALGVGKKLTYLLINTYNPYTFDKVSVIIAEERCGTYFSEKNKELILEDYKAGDKNIPYKIVKQIKGEALQNIRYEQLMPYKQPEDGDAFKVICADFVTTDSGTGIVHLAPSFGMDDYLAGKKNGIGSLTLVDKQGKFVDGVGEFSGLYVKNYNNEDENAPDYQSTDVKIAIKLKTENKAFKVEKYSHNYPHCWRTDKPILYYPMESWFIKTTAVKDKLLALNKTINWYPASTGEGRFGNWLENLVDWNLSRSRYWGTPLPIWRTKNGAEEICIGSIEELKAGAQKSIAAGIMGEITIDKDFDLHRPGIDEIVLVASNGEPMYRELDLIDVWFDSGAMPYAQWHYPFENKDLIDNKKAFPADFIAEGVDQTRGWFFTLHAISVMLNDSVAYKNVVANGLVLDKAGNKMSKSRGNSIDPFETIDTFGADIVRWYMLSNAAPWDNLKFDTDGLDETKRKFFGTLFNTYSFFALYANIDGFTNDQPKVASEHLTELDQWILSKINSLILSVTDALDSYEPHRATRNIQNFVLDDLSNWYVRLNRRRFWKGEMSDDKLAAYQTLHECLNILSKLVSSFSPFYADKLYQQLNFTDESVHLQDFPKVNSTCINQKLEHKIDLSQKLTSLILRIRKLNNIKVRQPLSKAIVPANTKENFLLLTEIAEMVKSEVNIKDLEILDANNDLIKKSAKPNFKTLGPKVGKNMGQVAQLIQTFSQEDILDIEQKGTKAILVDGQEIQILLEDLEIRSSEIPGWQVLTDDDLTVALDLTISEELYQEGIARELVNRIQNLRKERDFEVIDKIKVTLQESPTIKSATDLFYDYICGEILASEITFVTDENWPDEISIEEFTLGVRLEK